MAMETHKLHIPSYTGHIRDKVYTILRDDYIYYINSPRFHGENVEFSSMNRKYMCSVHKPVYFMDTRDVKPVYTYNNECLVVFV